MSTRNQMLCVWSAAVFAVLLFVGWGLLAGYLPPPSPSRSADTVASFYRGHTGMIRFGLLLALLGGPFVLPFAAVISAQMKRIEGAGPELAYAQLGGAILATVMLVIPMMVWTVAAFRPERVPDITQAIDDLGWILLIMPASPAMVQVFSIGAAILSDKAEHPVFPRWAGYFNIWTGVLFLPGLLLTFFKSGAFAWNGLLAFWLPFVVFFLWIIVMMILLPPAIRRQAGVANQA